MEIFPKLVYKDKNLQESRPQEPTPEQLKASEEIARDKLGKVMSPDFNDFSVRYVNAEEYRRTLESLKDLGGYGLGVGNHDKEVILHGPTSDHKETFLDFLKIAPDKITEYTQWYRGDEVVNEANTILSVIKHAGSEASQTREQKLDQIRNRILEFLERRSQMGGVVHRTPGWHEHTGSESIAARMRFLKPDDLKDMQVKVSEIFHNARNENFISGDLAELADQTVATLSLKAKQESTLREYIDTYAKEVNHGEENVKILLRVRDDPSYIQQKGALREIANAFTYLADTWGDKAARKYEIALIFDNSTYGFSQDTDWMPWASFDTAKNMKSLSDSEKKRGLLAAVSLVPLKDLYEEMIRLEKGSGDFAHPIFDSRGLLRWPEKSK